MGYSGAKLPDDGFELVHPFDDPPAVFEVLIEVAGVRHEAELEVLELHAENATQFVPEPDNSIDARAIRVESKGRKLGYVPRGHLDMLHRMLSEEAEVIGEIFRINGTLERPLVYVLTQITRQNGLLMPSSSLKMQA